MKKLIMIVAVAGMVAGFGMADSAIAVPNEWSDITYIEGNYSRIYFDWIVSGNTGTFYCINDWMTNQDDGGIAGGMLSNEYNRFDFTLEGDYYEIRIFPNSEWDIYKNYSHVDGALDSFNARTSWTTSPNEEAVDHTIWEFSFKVPGTTTTLTQFVGKDPKGPTTVVVQNPPTPPSILISGPSEFDHIVDGEFSDILVSSTIPPVPPRDYQYPVRDPFFDKLDGGIGWTIKGLEGGGTEIHIIPEPASLILSVLGLGTVGILRQRRAIC